MSTTALIFDRDAVEEVADWSDHMGRLRRSSILWIDVDKPSEDEIRELVDGLGLDEASAERLSSDDEQPYFGDFGAHLHVRAFAPSGNGNGRTQLAKIECVVAERWIVTVHDQPVAVLEEFRELTEGSGEIGRLDGPEFLADVLEWVLTAYLRAFDDLENSLEEFDARAMEGRFDDLDAELRRLVEFRQEVGRLRRAIVSHREMFLALTRPEIESITSSAHADRFEALRSQLENVIQAARDSRDSVVVSFDVLNARTEQRTNEVVKVLTLGSLLLLPGALIAGIFGMNFKLALFENNAYFWVVLALIVAIAFATVAAARMRRWV